MNDCNECPWPSTLFGAVGPSIFEYAIVLPNSTVWVGGESNVGFEGMVGVEGSEEVAVIMLGSAFSVVDDCGLIGSDGWMYGYAINVAIFGGFG